MSRMVNILLLAICFNAITHIEASDFGKFINKISTTASKIKSQLFEYFHRFRMFFTRHTESTHHLMTTRGCGYAVDDEPMIYNKRAKIVSKIKGGDDAIWHTWPWMVALSTKPSQSWMCAGVLVNEDTILTAAHCVFNRTANEIKAIIGVHTILGKLNPFNYYSIKSIYRHPDFEDCCKNDLAVIKLKKRVLYGPKINSVCLPFSQEFTVDNDQNLINRTGVIIGWGETSQNAMTNFIKSSSLQQADVLIFDNEYCNRAYEKIFDPATEICAGDYEQRTDTMSGDSGGPLLIRQSDGRWIVLGITSYGSDITPNLSPSVYVKLSAYEKWLEPYLKSN
ncbi:unnamed protein product [Rotaria socialis]|uniref:Peptidase S1 domain-containing protein n=1 Tax=Rotaria socialis TaxID=392032 RepID=A0A821CB52_9BILA|nr:unnamed protein product [Rotaria socialis]CAF3365065.1 unnamed protein product [Rotaria socialis]CAF3528665.1 unnamed protein product [Rotaria socialis]CAF4311330.1 unnamed protein product [Rotaria socialis]CAF4527526.1 unnamed protein product [Rotaria socialis]